MHCHRQPCPKKLVEKIIIIITLYSTDMQRLSLHGPSLLRILSLAMVVGEVQRTTSFVSYLSSYYFGKMDSNVWVIAIRIVPHAIIKVDILYILKCIKR